MSVNNCIREKRKSTASSTTRSISRTPAQASVETSKESPSVYSSPSLRVSSSRKKRPWSKEEETALVRAVGEYGEGYWADILEDIAYQHDLRHRDKVSLKDKWRNIKATNFKRSIKKKQKLFDSSDKVDEAPLPEPSIGSTALIDIDSEQSSFRSVLQRDLELFQAANEDLKAHLQNNTSLHDTYNRYCLIEADFRHFLMQQNGEAELLPLSTNQSNDEQTAESHASYTRITNEHEEEGNNSGVSTSNRVDEANTMVDIMDASYFATPSTTNYSSISIIQHMGDNMHNILLQECDTQPSSIKRRGKRDRVRISLSP